MKVLSLRLDIPRFWGLLRERRNSVLLLDYDGTLAPFRAQRDKAVPYPGVRHAIKRIMAAGCRVVIISGRSVRDLLPLLAVYPTPEIWGAHGRERLYSTGTYQLVPIGTEAIGALRKAMKWVKASGLESYIESKPGCLAFHVRGLVARQANKMLAQVREAWAPLGERHGLELHTFDGGLELRAEGCNKGQAVEAIFQESGPDLVAAYLGDDMTDEDAFRVIKGRGLGVLVRSELRSTGANLWIRPPQELLQFLSKWARICLQKRGNK
ncbi:MAG: trehalose-phosphatase [Nitrospiraceae bacterium]|nr:trehalose-phosphatase [Nitrospiraceae bacterium]